ncbi:MAG: large subunit ribosomal protein L5 [Verrucomicrobiales bacterium]|jgi:large subunit ribosomal protein L5
MVPVNIKQMYVDTILPKFLEDGKYANRYQAPRLEKVVINMGIGIAGDRDDLKAISADLANITGQRPVTTLAKKSISNFKLREGMPIGIKVTLRGQQMYDFLERLICTALPRIRDFRGISETAFDGRGNYTLGLLEQTIFPEINPDRVKRSQGMDISIVTTAKTNEEAKELLTLFGMPFASKN